MRPSFLTVLFIAVLTVFTSPIFGADGGTDDGTASGALVSGFNGALHTAGIKDASVAETYKQYQETYGPTFQNTIKFPIKEFIRGKDNGSAIWLLLKWGFIGSVMAVCIRVAYKASKGDASVADLGWSISKTGISVILINFPGLLYLLIVCVPAFFCGAISTSLKPDKGVNEQSVQLAVEDGVRMASALAVNTIVSIQDEKSRALAVQAVNGMISANLTKEQMKEAEIDLIQIPLAVLEQRDGADGKKIDIATGRFEYVTELFTLSDGYWRNQAGHTGESLDVLLSKQGKTNARITWDPVVKAKLNSDVTDTIRKFAKTWRYWPANSVLNKGALDEIRSEANQELFEAETADDRTKILSGVARDAYEKIDAAFYSQFVVRGISKGGLGVYHDARKNGLTQLKSAIEAFKEKEGGWIAKKIHDFVAGFVIKTFVHGIAFLWLVAVELMMLNLILMLPFWVHPTTEQGALKAFKRLAGLALAAPLYIISLFLADKVFSAFGNIGGVAGFILGPMFIILSVVSMIAPPLAAIFLTKVFFDSIFKGTSMLGGMMKVGLGGLGTGLAMAFPAVRGATMAAAAMASSSANSQEEMAGKTSNPQEQQRHMRKAKFRRAIAQKLDMGQKTIGQAFGVDEKYMSREKTVAQNVRGGVRATAAAVTAGAKAMASGTGATGVFEGVAAQGAAYDRVKREMKGERTEEAQSVERIVKQQQAVAEKQNELLSAIATSLQQAKTAPGVAAAATPERPSAPSPSTQSHSTQSNTATTVPSVKRQDVPGSILAADESMRRNPAPEAVRAEAPPAPPAPKPASSRLQRGRV